MPRWNRSAAKRKSSFHRVTDLRTGFVHRKRTKSAAEAIQAFSRRDWDAYQPHVLVTMHRLNRSHLTS